jgi:hypothetical protein
MTLEQKDTPKFNGLNALRRRWLLLKRHCFTSVYYEEKDIIKKCLNEIAEHLRDEDFSKSLESWMVLSSWCIGRSSPLVLIVIFSSLTILSQALAYPPYDVLSLYHVVSTHSFSTTFPTVLIPSHRPFSTLMPILYTSALVRTHTNGSSLLSKLVIF